MLRDIRAGMISPAATPSSLANRYGMKSQKRMIAAMQEACRQHETESGKMMIAIDDDTGHILRSFALPAEFCERIETFALRVAIQALNPHGQSPGKTFNEQGEICLHVYVMPGARYRKRQGSSVKAVGTHVFTFRTWNKTVEEVDAPFPEDRPISREVTGWYSPGLGYQGFDGQNWHSDWFTYDPPGSAT